MILEYPKRITLKDIARTANLSVAAVSMALRNHPSLPQHTIERVKRIAEELGYRPDPVLSALSAHRARMKHQSNVSVIAFITNWSTRDGWLESPGARQLFTHASAQADRLGYDLQPFWARQHGGFSPRLSQVLQARGIRSVILAPAENEAETNDMDWTPFTVVSLEPPALDARLPHAGLSHYNNVLRCWHELSDRGITRVGFISRGDSPEFTQGQGLAAHAYQQSRCCPPHDRIPDLNLSKDTPADQLRTWLQTHRPVAVISSEPIHHLLPKTSLLKPPDQFSYVSLNVLSEEAADVSGIDPGMDRLGETVVETLNQLQQRGLTGQNISPVGTQITGIWRDGSTLVEPVVLAKSG